MCADYMGGLHSELHRGCRGATAVWQEKVLIPHRRLASVLVHPGARRHAGPATAAAAAAGAVLTVPIRFSAVLRQQGLLVGVMLVAMVVIPVVVGMGTPVGRRKTLVGDFFRIVPADSRRPMLQLLLQLLQLQLQAVQLVLALQRGLLRAWARVCQPGLRGWPLQPRCPL